MAIVMIETLGGFKPRAKEEFRMSTDTKVFVEIQVLFCLLLLFLILWFVQVVGVGSCFTGWMSVAEKLQGSSIGKNHAVLLQEWVGAYKHSGRSESPVGERWLAGPATS